MAAVLAAFRERAERVRRAAAARDTPLIPLGTPMVDEPVPLVDESGPTAIDRAGALATRAT